MFRQADGDLGLCCYIIPGGRSKIGDLKRMHHSFIKEDPFISAELGPGAKMEKMKSGFLRIEAVSESYSDHLLIVGDAAGKLSS